MNMFNNFRESIREIFEHFLKITDFTLIHWGKIELRALNLILAAAVYFVGIRLIRILIKKTTKLVLNRWIKDRSAVIWIENFLGIVLFIQLIIVFLIMVGVPVSILNDVRHWKLLSIGDRTVEFGNLVIGLFMLYPGVRLSHYLSTRFHNIVLERFRLDQSTRKSLSAIFQYLLIVLVILFVLSFIGIPLTAFTVVGGAIAIGIGLGSQNLVNNFLSGLVMMVEKPLKIGDIVEVDDRRGQVENIGARSTRIRTNDNLRLVIPNSQFLETTVVNYSLIDDVIRREVIVGVAYGSPVEKVRDLMMEAADQHQHIQRDPAPLVLFADFGDNSLVFRVLFWIKIKKFVDAYVVESDLRFALDRMFREADITIAFPQRDIHMDTLSPLEVRIRPDKHRTEEEPQK